MEVVCKWCKSHVVEALRNCPRNCTCYTARIGGTRLCLSTSMFRISAALHAASCDVEGAADRGGAAFSTQAARTCHFIRILLSVCFAKYLFCVVQVASLSLYFWPARNPTSLTFNALTGAQLLAAGRLTLQRC